MAVTGFWRVSGEPSPAREDRIFDWLSEGTVTPIFLDAYREALYAWQQGDHAVIFPFGTWKIVRHHAAVVAIPPPDSRR